MVHNDLASLPTSNGVLREALHRFKNSHWSLADGLLPNYHHTSDRSSRGEATYSIEARGLRFPSIACITVVQPLIPGAFHDADRYSRFDF